jgi:hypothetical protein
MRLTRALVKIAYTFMYGQQFWGITYNQYGKKKSLLNIDEHLTNKQMFLLSR